MDLRTWLLRWTPPRPLVVTAPGGTAARLAAEREVRTRGWRPAENPAEANLLVVAGVAGEVFGGYVERVWAQMPAPRARVDVPDGDGIGGLLDAAVEVLRDTERQRNEAALTARSSSHDAEAAPHGADHDGHGTDPKDAHSRHGGDHPGEGEHAGHSEHADHHSHADHGGHAEHSGHGGHPDHGGHSGHGGHAHHMDDMELPGGLPMADRAPDRDGLMLDQLHVPLGPALPWWPAGLIVHTRLQGDVVQHAAVEVLPPAHHGTRPGNAPARRLDSCARLLALAGWPDAAVTAQRLRDDLLTGTPTAESAVRRWAKRVNRSRTLRWLLTDIGSTSDAPDALTGDAWDRLRRWLDAILAGHDAPLPEPDETQWTVDHLPGLLTGTELATARLVVASFDPDLDLLVRHGAHHG